MPSALETLATAIINKNDQDALSLLENVGREEILKKVECRGKQKQSCRNQHPLEEVQLLNRILILLRYLFLIFIRILLFILPYYIGNYLIYYTYNLFLFNYNYNYFYNLLYGPPDNPYENINGNYGLLLIHIILNRNELFELFFYILGVSRSEMEMDVLERSVSMCDFAS